MKTAIDNNARMMKRASIVALLTVGGLIAGWCVSSVGQLAVPSLNARNNSTEDGTGAPPPGRPPSGQTQLAEEEGDSLAKAAQYEGAIECYDRSIYGDSWLFMPISEWFVKGNDPQHLEDRNEMQSKKYATRYAKRGDIHAALGHYQQALDDYEKANDLSAGEVEVERIAHVLCLLGAYDRAVLAYSKAIAKTPSQADWYLKRSALQRKLERIRSAEEDRKNALGIAGEKIAQRKDDLSYFLRARLNLAIKTFDDALKDIDRAIELSPASTDRAPYFAKRAEINLALGKTESAIDDIKKSERNKRPWSLLARAKVLLAEGRLQDAIADLDAAIAEKYTDATAHYLRGQACTRLGLREEAEKELNLARTLGYWADPTVQLGI